jgi:hypothetical protein
MGYNGAFGFHITSIPSTGLTYKGVWNASTNNPILASGIGTAGDYYIVSVAGTTNLDGITDWEIGDWAIFSSSGVWQKIDNSESKSVLYTIELVNAFTTDFYAPFNISIDSYVQIVGSATITITINSLPYVLGNAISTGDQITITSNNTSVVNLNCTQL